MIGVITKRQVLAHPIVIFEAFGPKVLWRALLAGRGETFLEIVSRCAEEEANEALDQLDLARTVRRFIGFERRASDVYRRVSGQLADRPEAARFFAMLSRQEEGHAIVLTRVQRELRRGRLWKESKDLHLASLDSFAARFAGWEEQARRGVTLEQALGIVEGIEGSELNVVFDSLNGCVDMRSRSRFERFFVMTHRHLAFCREQVQLLREGTGAGA